MHCKGIDTWTCRTCKIGSDNKMITCHLLTYFPEIMTRQSVRSATMVDIHCSRPVLLMVLWSSITAESTSQLHFVALVLMGPLTSIWPHLRCDVGLEEGEYKWKLSLCYSIVYYYNGAQRYEQFLQVGWLYRALILLGLALVFQAPVSLVLMMLYRY